MRRKAQALQAHCSALRENRPELRFLRRSRPHVHPRQIRPHGLARRAADRALAAVDGIRPENELDLERTFEVALEEGVAVEVNGLPDRLDLRGELVRDAIAAGVRIVCSTDAHSVRGLDNIAFSVATARRGWATAAHVLNTQPLEVVLSRP